MRTSVARLARDGWLQCGTAGRRSEYRLSASGRRALRRGHAAHLRAHARAVEPALDAAAAAGREAAPHGRARGPAMARVRAAARRPLRASGHHPGAGACVAARHTRRRGRAAAGERRRGPRLRPPACRAGLGPAGPRRALRALRARVSRRSRLALAGAELGGERAFLVRTLLIHEYRKVHLQDPLLPPDAAACGLGRRARLRDCAPALRARCWARPRRFLSATAHRLQRTAAGRGGGAYARFGGLRV